MKTHFWSSLHVYKMKNRLLKRFSSLQNENMFSILKLSLFQKKKERFKNMYGHVSVFYFVSVKNSSKMCFFILWVSKTITKRTFLFLSKRKTLQNFYDSFFKNKECLKNVCFIFKHEIWFKSMVYEVSVEIIFGKNKNNFVVAEFFLSRMCFLKMSKIRILENWLFTHRFESGYSPV